MTSVRDNGSGNNGGPNTSQPQPADYTDGNYDPNATSPLGRTTGEPNDTFTQALVAVFDADGLARIKGTISHSADIDVFRLPEMKPGDRIIADGATVQSDLDMVLVLYDHLGRMVYENDDRTGSNPDSYIDFVVRHAGDPYYLAVSRAAFAVSGTRTGSYTVELRLSSGAEVPKPNPQILVLNFAGGFVESGILSGPKQLAPFDAATVHSSYAGQTVLMKNVILQTVQSNFSRFHVTVLSSDEALPPNGSAYSTMFFGSTHPNAFGIAEQIDLYNLHVCDDGIVFTESFRPSLFGTLPTAAQMAVAIGNTASHEAGHLLGLNHVDDPIDLMDGSSPANTLLADQEFGEAPLSSDILPLGTQDSVLLLLQAVGPRP